jgi:hypothetical protein
MLREAQRLSKAIGRLWPVRTMLNKWPARTSLCRLLSVANPEIPATPLFHLPSCRTGSKHAVWIGVRSACAASPESIPTWKYAWTILEYLGHIWNILDVYGFFMFVLKCLIHITEIYRMFMFWIVLNCFDMFWYYLKAKNGNKWQKYLSSGSKFWPDQDK